MEWIQPAQDRDTFRFLMNVVMNGFHNTRITLYCIHTDVTINSSREYDSQSQLRMFITCTGIWLQHVSAGIDHHQRIQNTRDTKKDKNNYKRF